MSISLEAVAVGAARECVRQEVDTYALGSLLQAYHVAYTWSKEYRAPDEQKVRTIAAFIEPNFNGEYRSTPVTFASGGTSASHADIPRLMDRHMSWLPSSGDSEGWLEFNANAWVSEFLWIHPFRDGNGRTAWILLNWLQGTLENPTPLPEYYK